MITSERRSWTVGFVIAFHIVCQASHAKSAAVSCDSSIKQALLENLSAEERHQLFSDILDPVFHLVRPSLLQHPCSDRPDCVRLVIKMEDVNVDSVLAPSDGLVAPHLLTGIHIDGEMVDLPLSACHFRKANVTHVLAVNNCHDSLEGIVITPHLLVTLHPLPQHLLPILMCHLPCESFDDTLIVDTTEGSDSYGIHIVHVVEKADLAVHGRTRRNTRDQQTVCATGPEHDMRDEQTVQEQQQQVLRHPRFRNLSEISLAVDVLHDLSRSQDNLFLNVSSYNETHNHTVEASPVSVVIKKTVELAVFCDQSLYKNFPQKVDTSHKSRLVHYILTLINAVQGIYHQEELQGFVIDIRIVRLDIHTTNNGPSSSGGDIGAYLTSFCSWQKQQNPTDDYNPQHWDHAIMLSGEDLHSSGNPSVIGLAWVAGMCRPSISCTMNEGRSFTSVYVVAHELGHNLGMNHDGQGDASQCSSSKYIMSPSVGPGKTTWSSCSVQLIHSFLRRSTCLDDGGDERGPTFSPSEAGDSPPETDNQGDIEKDLQGHGQVSGEVTTDGTVSGDRVKVDTILMLTPGYQFKLPDQCKAMFGPDFYPALTKLDLCDYLYCTNGVVTRPAHPALEGSFCGNHRVCIAGKCRPEEELASLTLYSVPSQAHSGGSVPSATLPSSEFAPVVTTSPQTSSTEESSVSNATNIEQPVTEALNLPYNCSCDFTADTTHYLPNIPREICPYLAPVYHTIFNCSTECLQYDLHVDLASGNLTKFVQELNLLDETVESCTYESYSILSDAKTLAKTLLSEMRIPFVDPSICQALPQFLHPYFDCPRTDPVTKRDCPPQKVIIKMSEHNLTFVQGTENRRLGKSLKLKGNSYTLTGEEGNLYNEEATQILIGPLTESTDKESRASYIKCDLEATFAEELKDLPDVVCQFLAPSLHDLFNCSSHSQCTKSVMFINMLENVISKYPVKHFLKPAPPCPLCFVNEQSASALLLDIFTAVIKILLGSKVLSNMMPSAWLNWIPGCDSAALIASASEEVCPPVAVIILIDNTAFQYTPYQGGGDIEDQSKIKWHNYTFGLKEITTSKDIAQVMQTKYQLNVYGQVTRKILPQELVVLPHQSINYSSLSREGGSPSLPAANISLSSLPRAVDKRLPSKPLQEYIGQKDVFLPINAPEAMPRTKVGACSVTCGSGMRLLEMECIDSKTEQLVDDDACQGYIVPKQRFEPCHMPNCTLPRWSVGDWGACSDPCAFGVQFRRVECVIVIKLSEDEEVQGQNPPINLVVDKDQCKGESPRHVRDCVGSCQPAPHCDDTEDCFDYHDVQISKDFDYK